MQTLISRSPNAQKCGNTLGIETSQYRQEKKIIIIPLLAASEKGTGQAESALETKLEMWLGKSKESRKSFLESCTSEGDSPVFEDSMMEL